jgi:long-subunit fatty acid transport protein
MRRAALALALGALLVSAGAEASPVDSFGLGSRSTAMGGAVSASVRDFSANYYNPSGLALARGTDLSAGYMVVSQQLELNGHDSQVDPVRAIVGGVVAPGAVLMIPFAFGLAVHLPDERLSRARSMRAEDPRWVLWDNRPQLIYLSTNLAIRPLEWLAIGGGVSFLAATRGAFEITGTAVLPVENQRTEYDSQLRHEVDADLTAVRYPAFGVTVSPSDRLDFALVYRDQAEIELEIDAQLRGRVDATLLTVPARYELSSTTMNAFVPRQLVLGASWRPLDRLLFGIDLTWVNWAAYESPISRSSSELDVDLDLPGFELPPNPKPTSRVDPGFRNRLVPRAGVEYRLPVRRRFDLPLRAGYVFERSPVPPQTGRTSFADADRHVLSLGAGFLWSEPGDVLPGNLRFDTHLQWAILPTQVTLKDNPADYTGDFSAGGSQLGVGATLSLGFP